MVIGHAYDRRGFFNFFHSQIELLPRAVEP